MNLSEDAISRLKVLAESNATDVVVVASELRALMKEQPENAACAMWISAYGDSTGEMRIARSTLKALLRIPISRRNLCSDATAKVMEASG
jgi:hypothetical protein